MPLGSFESLPFRHGCAATLSPFHGDSFWLVLPPACPERGFEPSAPSGRCSEGRIGRNREYCKRQRCKTTIFQPALWVSRSESRRGYKAAHCSLFISTPQSHFVRQLPGRGAFGVQYKHGVQCRTPSRSDRFNGVTGGAGGPKGRNRNLPWPPGKKVYSPALGSSSLGPLPR